jgi:hypothetical protein
MWCVPEIDAEFIDRMEDVLELYARKALLVCLLDHLRPLRGIDVLGPLQAIPRAVAHGRHLHLSAPGP